MGAVLMKQAVADVMAPGDHGSTFAGNPLVCHAANAVVDIISDPAFLMGVCPQPRGSLLCELQCFRNGRRAWC